jgi:hypothetical protein
MILPTELENSFLDIFFIPLGASHPNIIFELRYLHCQNGILRESLLRHRGI